MPAQPVVVACLCAAWCRTCEAYAPVLRQAESCLADEGLRLNIEWIDIEDEADLVGEFDVPTFPTLVVADDLHVRFAGPVTPEPDTLLRLLRSLLLEAAPHTRWRPVASEVEAFVQRLRQRRIDP